MKSDSILYLFFLVYIILLPLPFGGDWPWAMGIYEVVIFLLSAYWLFLYAWGRVEFPMVFKKAWPVYGLFVLWLLYLAIAVISPGRLSVAPHLTTSAWMMSLVYAQVFFLTLVLVNTRKRVLWLANVIIFCGLFQAVFGGLMTLSGVEYSLFINKVSGIGVATGTFYNRNHLAAYLVMCLATGIGLMIGSLSGERADTWKQRLRNISQLLLSPKARLRLYLVVMVIALVLTHSRMGNISFLAGLLIAGGLGLLLSRHAPRPVVILLASLIVIDIFVVGAWFGIDKVAERLEQTSLETEARDNVFPYVYQQWSDNRLTGTGLGTFLVVFPYYRGNDIQDLYKQAHNDYLQFGSETGLIGLAILASMALSSLSAAVFAQYRRHDPLMRGISFAAMMGMIAMLLHATVEFNFQIPPNAAMFVVLMGLGWVSLFLKEKVRSEE